MLVQIVFFKILLDVVVTYIGLLVVMVSGRAMSCEQRELFSC